MADFFEHNFLAYRPFINEEKYALAIEACLQLLAAYREADAAKYAAEHKGSPFYVMGYAAFASHDYGGASVFFDAAVAEDIRKQGTNANTPALNFIQLRDDTSQMLATEIMKVVRAAVQALLDDYNARPGAANLTLDELRNRFLVKVTADSKEERRALVTTFLSFAAEWGYRQRLIRLLANGSREPFLVHLFRGSVLFESLLKENRTRMPPPAKDTLGAVLGDLKQELGATFKGTPKAVFNTVVKSLTPAQSIADTMSAAIDLRNTTGHKISWETSNLNDAQYDLAVKTLASACIHVISKLYP